VLRFAALSCGEGGSFYIRCLKFVKVLFFPLSKSPLRPRGGERPCSRSRFSGSGAFPVSRSFELGSTLIRWSIYLFWMGTTG